MRSNKHCDYILVALDKSNRLKIKDGKYLYRNRQANKRSVSKDLGRLAIQSANLKDLIEFESGEDVGDHGLILRRFLCFKIKNDVVFLLKYHALVPDKMFIFFNEKIITNEEKHIKIQEEGEEFFKADLFVQKSFIDSDLHDPMHLHELTVEALKMAYREHTDYIINVNK